MNLILLEPSDFIGPHQVRLTDRRWQHIQQVHQAKLGESLRVGLINGLMGLGTVTALDTTGVTLQIALSEPPPTALPLTLVLALPRPKMLKRTLQTIASMGVKRLILVNSYRVEKSFWQSPFLQAAAIREQLLLGLEQARDTVLPEVILEKRFKPFIEDRLPALTADSLALVAHPGAYPACPRQLEQQVTLAIGPEGGWIPYEVELLTQAGFSPVQLGERILRVETAVPVLLARLF
ncbi:16S rRNA (uracil(1498)-N(3))-methyltransferase [Thiopseudomonas alkaliphila]|uniref:16S rRNA (uracil(1498)-N(3))-methyltransferase n=1 Tax=Thiopseudomonas alkaliphila TaxID=1697053 RepID=UPI00069E5716|nr:16S rRNA (uracil(1498)-N(3))-methyltransferase [Thiopseudomonas alkaliphila]AKX51554.1 16S rRNA methyltransferase [Thiopseudomonas alkaliphila]AKX57899.1 16S rRNA methyltransferase [Thiopseudomonas alkaliphila]